MSSCAGAIPWNWRCAHKGVNPQPKLLDLPWHLVPVLYGETWLQRFFSTSLHNLSPLSPCRFVENLSKSKVWRYFCNSSNEKTSFKFGFQTTQLALHRSKLSSLKRDLFFKHLCFRWGSRTEVPFEVVSSVNQMSVSGPEILRGTTGWKCWSYTKLLESILKTTTLRMRWLQANAPGFLATAQSLYQESSDEPGSRDHQDVVTTCHHLCSRLFRLVVWKWLNHFHDSMDGCRRAASEHSTVASQFLWFWCALIIIHGRVCESKFSTFLTSMILCIEAINPAIMNTLITSMLRHWL